MCECPACCGLSCPALTLFAGLMRVWPVWEVCRWEWRVLGASLHLSRREEGCQCEGYCLWLWGCGPNSMTYQPFPVLHLVIGEGTWSLASSSELRPAPVYTALNFHRRSKSFLLAHFWNIAARHSLDCQLLLGSPRGTFVGFSLLRS